MILITTSLLIAIYAIGLTTTLLIHLFVLFCVDVGTLNQYKHKEKDFWLSALGSVFWPIYLGLQVLTRVKKPQRLPNK